MALIDIYKTSNLGYHGQDNPGLKNFSKYSTLHNTSSINGVPNINRVPSTLDLNGITPAKYLDNPPR